MEENGKRNEKIKIVFQKERILLEEVKEIWKKKKRAPITLGPGAVLDLGKKRLPTLKKFKSRQHAKDKFLYAMSKDLETGFVKIIPMNRDAITIHGEKEALFFIQMLIECLQR